MEISTGEGSQEVEVPDFDETDSIAFKRWILTNITGPWGSYEETARMMGNTSAHIRKATIDGQLALINGVDEFTGASETDRSAFKEAAIKIAKELAGEKEPNQKEAQLDTKDKVARSLADKLNNDLTVPMVTLDTVLENPALPDDLKVPLGKVMRGIESAAKRSTELLHMPRFLETQTPGGQPMLDWDKSLAANQSPATVNPPTTPPVAKP